jgi:mannose-1-phosphate guanylyltransferase
MKGLYKTEKVIDLDNKDNFVMSTSGKPVALIGVEDLMVIEDEKGILVCRRDQTGRVGEVVGK